MAEAIENNIPSILKANITDLEFAKNENIPAPLVSRLALNENKVLDMVKGIRSVINLPDPVALGTIIHSSLFLATSLIAEKFGDSFAKKAISFSILSPVLFTVIMLLTLGAKPIMPQNILAYEAHTAMKTLFVPLPAIIVASLLTFYASQHVMLCFLNWIKKIVIQCKHP